MNYIRVSMKYNTKLTYKIYWEHVKKHKISGLVVVISATLAIIGNLIPPILYKQFFDILAETGDINTRVPELINIILNVLIIYLIAWVFWRLAEFFNAYFQTKMMADLANTCFAYIHKHSFSFFNNNFVGSLVKRVNRFYRSFEVIADVVVWDILQLVVGVLIITTVLFWKSTILGTAVVIWIVFIIIINYFFSKYKLKYDVQRSAQDTKVTGVMADSITNNVNIKLFCGYKRENKLFNSATKRLQELRIFTWNLAAVFEAVQILLMILLEIVIFYFAVKLWQRGVVTVGDFVLIQAYIVNLFHRFHGFGKVIRRLYESLADAEEMTVILDTPHEIVDKKRAKDLVVKKGKIEFVNTRFNYHKTRNILPNFSLTIKPQEKIALVGPSGAGKSTIIKLLLRMHDLSAGKIFIDGQSVSDITQESLWQNISLVPQDPILFHRSLMENIRYGKPEATDEEVIQASKLARCHNFIESFPEKYVTYVGERGVKLSGGERQRVAIARAILRNAPILILDEATSSLDSESEKLIQEALDDLMLNKTVIVVAHRLSTIMRMDRIVVVDEGKVKEEGTHAQLTKKKTGLYSRLWEVQAGGFIT